jgi:hypothetical protein
MSKEEKTLILQMVADGQITPEQGVELLNALEPGKPRELPHGVTQGISEGLSRGLPWETDIEDVVRQKVEGAAVRAGDIAQGVAGNIGKVISQIFADRSFGGPRFELTDEIKGEFPDEGEIDVTLTTTNGRVVVEAWDEPGYLLTVVKRVDGRDEDEAKQALEGCYEFKHDGLSLEAKAITDLDPVFRNMSVRFLLRVPGSRKVSLNIKSSNGRVVAENVLGSSCSMSSANGRVVALGCEFDKARVSTANGRIEYQGVAGELEASTANGTVTADLKGTGNWKFSSANGRITVNVSKDEDAAYELDLTARSGGITVEGLDDLEAVEEQVMGRQRRRYKARSRGFDDAQVKGRIKATTNNGKIRVVF